MTCRRVVVEFSQFSTTSQCDNGPCWSMAVKPSSIDDIFGPRKGARTIEAQKFKMSFGNTSTNLTRNCPVFDNAEVVATLPPILSRQPSLFPPLKQTLPAAAATKVDLSQPPIYDLKTPVPRVNQETLPSRPTEVAAVPNYLRPRANVRTQEEVEAEAVLQRAKGLVHALNDMEALAHHPELDSAFLKRQRRANAEQRAHELRQARALEVESAVRQRELRSERALMDLEVHKTTEATTRALRSQFKTAKTSLSRALHTDPILKSAMAAAALRAERGEAEPDLTRFGFAPSVGVSGREGSISGGHSKEGNEAIRRARRTATRALSNL